jgi:hypothetical protein
MKCKVIREFRRAIPGSVYGEVLAAGSESEIEDENLAAALEREGYISPISDQAPAPKGGAEVTIDAPPAPGAATDSAPQTAPVVEPPAKPAKSGGKK